ncbi:MAG: DUF58 domain-containing protein [Saprospiraceae bacterium]|nr:DUF58 domain-containing protein [Saprospiraceae bacterium]
MDTTELLKKVRKVELKTRGLSHHLFTGGYHSAFKGRGMSFSEVRMYQFGDDVRSIDWNVTARTGAPHVKIFEEERELTVMLLVDISGSSFFGTTGLSKQEVLTEICAVLAFSAISNNDKVGLLLFSDKPELFIAPKKGRQHILRIIRELVNVRPSDKGTDLAAALQYTRNVMKKRTVCFVLSDFQTENYEAPLRILARRHDFIGLQCWDPRERVLPNVGLLHVKDPESVASRWIDTSNPAIRQGYTQRFDQHQVQTAALFRRAGADFLSVQTTDSYVNALLRFFEQRST